MDNKPQITVNGIGMPGLLFVLFTALKLTHVIDWSWFWITAPLWIPVILIIAFIFLFLIIHIMAGK